MAHEISITVDGLAEAMYAQKPAWHGLGQVLDHAPNSEEAIKQAHLDWEVGVEEIQTVGGILLPGHRATVRKDTDYPLGIVSDRYQVVQNRESFEFLGSLLQDGVMKYEAAGALKGGRLVWLLARLPSVNYVAPGDALLNYILFSTSHDGSGSIFAEPTQVRVVCANTHRLATREMTGFRHIGNVKGKLEKAKQYLSQFDEQFTLFRDKAKLLATKKVAGPDAKQYVETLFPSVVEEGRARTIRENKVAKLRENFTNPRQTIPAIKGSWWALYNSVSEFVDHQGSYRGGDDAGKAENRMLSVMNGHGAAMKDKAFDLAVEMAA